MAFFRGFVANHLTSFWNSSSDKQRRNAIFDDLFSELCSATIARRFAASQLSNRVWRRPCYKIVMDATNGEKYA
jgi:hypothetical protein